MLISIQGGGQTQKIRDFTLRICGIKIKKTKHYKKLLLHHHLYPNLWFADSINILKNIDIAKIEALLTGLDKRSAHLICSIIHREKYAAEHPLGVFSLLTAQEITARERIYNEFLPNIFHIATNLYYWNGYFLPKRHGLESFWYRHGIDTLNNRAYFKDKDIIDVGGYIGDSALILQEYTSKNVHSFEATTSNYHFLLDTIRLNAAKRIIPVNKALGSSNGKMNITICGGSSSLVAHNSDNTEEVEIITLDSYVEIHKLQVGFIKVDIEGFEMAFLEGAKRTICTQKPTMLISIYHSLEHFFGIKPLIESWDLGYHFSIYKPIDETISVETGLFCEILSK